MKRLPAYFAKGLLFFIPLVVTLMIIGKMFSMLDGMLGRFFHLEFPGVGVVLGVVLVTGFGFLSTTIFMRGIMNFIDKVFQKAPFVRLLYTSLRDLVNAFVDKPKLFGKPVMVEITGAGGGRALGFITTEALEHFGLRDHVAVYFPQSYNFAGQILVYPKDKVTPLPGVSGPELMAFVVSAGISGKHAADQTGKYPG